MCKWSLNTGWNTGSIFHQTTTLWRLCPNKQHWRSFTDERQNTATPPHRPQSLHVIHWQTESSLRVPFPTLRLTCEYPACIRWLREGEPWAKLWLHAQLCRRTVFTRHLRAHITSARAINTQGKIINPVLQGHRHTDTQTEDKSCF